MVKKAVILCGGLATRFLPLSKSIPKEMLPILNRPAIDYCIEDLKNNGITDILIILGRNKEILENYYDRNIELEEKLTSSRKTQELQSVTDMFNGVNITFMRQLYAKGTGYAVSIAKTWVGEDNFVLMFPDELIVGKSYVKQMLDAHEITKTSVIPLKEIYIKDCTKYGMIDFTNDNVGCKIKGIVEKPSIKNAPSNISYMGGGVFTSEIFEHLAKCTPQPNGEIYLIDAFAGLIKKDKLYGQLIDGEMIDFGNPIGFVKGNIIAGLNHPEYKEELLAFIKYITQNN